MLLGVPAEELCISLVPAQHRASDAIQEVLSPTEIPQPQQQG